MRASSKLALLALLLWVCAVATPVALKSTWAAWFSEREFVANRFDQRMNRLAASRPHCRILIVGSSNVVLGLDAAELAARTGCAALNLGLYVIGETLNSYLDVVLARAYPGDIIVLADRRWTEDFHIACEDRSFLACLDFDLEPTLIPAASAYLRRMVGSGPLGDPKRTNLGDMLVYTALPKAAKPRPYAPIDQRTERERLMARQVNNIHNQGGEVVLAAVPRFVTADDQPKFAQDYQQAGQQFARITGAGHWVLPLLLTDPQYFSLDAWHTSAAGRRLWTEDVAKAIAEIQARHANALPPRQHEISAPSR